MKPLVHVWEPYIHRSEAVVRGKDSSRIGTGEVYEAVDNRVPLPADRHHDGTVKAEPAVAVEGAAKLRIAGGVPQLNVIDIAIAAANAHSRRAESFDPVSNRRDLPRNLTAKGGKRESAL